MREVLVPLILVVLATGCPPATTKTTPPIEPFDANLQDPDVVRAMSRASAYRIYLEQLGLVNIAQVHGRHGCPVETKSEDGTTTTYTGGCVSFGGTKFDGMATVSLTTYPELFTAQFAQAASTTTTWVPSSLSASGRGPASRFTPSMAKWPQSL